MNDYLLFADATADLPADLVERYQVRYVPMEVEISGETISFCADWTAEQSHAFYERLRSGEKATTTQITPFVYESIFAPAGALAARRKKCPFPYSAPPPRFYARGRPSQKRAANVGRPQAGRAPKAFPMNRPQDLLARRGQLPGWRGRAERVLQQ